MCLKLQCSRLEKPLSTAVLPRLSCVKPNCRGRYVVQASGEHLPVSNVIMAPTKREMAGSGVLTRRQIMEEEVRRKLQVVDSWHKDKSCRNMVMAASRSHFKETIMSCDPTRIVLVDFFSPSCYACRSMWPKLKQIAASNPDITFLKVNTAEKPLASLAEGMGVSKLPWFLIFQGGTGEQIASFTANLSTISDLRDRLCDVQRHSVFRTERCQVPSCT